MELDWASGDVILADGVEVARAERSWFRTRAEVQIGPELWAYRSEGGWTRSTLVGELDGAVRLRATRTGFFTSTWTVDGDAEPISLSSGGWIGTRLTIRRDLRTIGEARSSGIFTTRSRISLSEPVPTQVGCFLLWVAHVELSRRQSSAGAGAST